MALDHTMRRLWLVGCAAMVALVLFGVRAKPAAALQWGQQWSGSFTDLQSAAEWEALDRSGASMIRISGSWGWVQQAGQEHATPEELSKVKEPWETPAAWKYTYDQVFRLAAEHEVEILTYLYARKTDAARKQFYLYEGAEKEAWNEWLKFVWTFVQRYGRGGYFWDANGDLTGGRYRPDVIWEVWNEPNLPENNPGGTTVLPQKYAEFLIANSNTITTAQNEVRNPGEPNDTVVVHGGLSQYGMGKWTVGAFLAKEVLVSGFSSSFGGLGIHPYWLSGTEGEKLAGVVQNVENARNGLNAYGLGTKSLWITELGWPVGGAGNPISTEDEQAKLLTQSFNWIASKNVAFNIRYAAWYASKDISDPSWAYHCGLRDVNGSFRPAWYAFLAQTGAPTWPPPPVPAPPVRVSFADAPNAQSVSTWTWDSTSGWQQYPLWGHRIAAGSSPATLRDGGGSPHVFYVDEPYGNTITHWKWSNGWQQEPFFGHTVAAGSSPSAISVGGTLHVFFVDASNNNTITDWKWSSGTGWQQEYFYGHSVAAGTSPSAIVDSSGNPRVYFVDASDNNTITQWKWNSVTGWQQEFFWGLPAAAGSSPSATVDNQGNPRVFFVNATNNNTITDWRWTSGTGWQQQHLWGHPVAAKSNPSAMMVNGALEVFFADASNSNSITVWVWTSSLGWVGQAVLGGHSLATGSSPSAVMNGSTPNVYFVDANNLNSITDWQWNSSSGWQQIFLYGHEVAAKSSPGGFSG
jgi:hypothetical protein